jgi:hypothetical protein
MSRLLLALTALLALAGCAVVPAYPRPVAVAPVLVAPAPVVVAPPPPAYFGFSYRSGPPGYYGGYGRRWRGW